ncbi:MAG: pilin [Thermochromatium sp.]
MKRYQQGFTLIELMIVVAIIAILAAIALPTYQDYAKRAHVSEGLNLAASAKTAVSEFYASQGRFPKNNTSAGLPQAGSITGNAVRQVEVSTDGLITITYNEKVENNGTLLLSPEALAGAVTWTCKNGSISNARYIPSSCKQGGTGGAAPPVVVPPGGEPVGPPEPGPEPEPDDSLGKVPPLGKVPRTRT